MSTDQTRQLIKTTDMGHSADSSEHSLNPVPFEQADDPTIHGKPSSPYEPVKQARKAAEEGERLEKKKKTGEAIAKYREAVALDPHYFEAANNLALALESSGQKDEAEQIFRRLIDSNPEHVLAFTNLASLLNGEKRYAEAEAVMRLAMKQHSYSFKANLVLGALLVTQGKWTDEAKTKLEYAKTRYPGASDLLGKWPSKP